MNKLLKLGLSIIGLAGVFALFSVPLAFAAPIIVPSGGTGQTTLPAHGVLLGQGVNGVASLVPGTIGYVLTSNGASADPTYQPAGNALTFTYPLQLIGGVVSTAFSTTTANTWASLQTFSSGISSNGVTDSAVTGSTQCAQFNSSGQLSGTGSACGSGSGSVASVSNADGTLTISPTTGAVVASLNPAHTNTFTATQNFANINFSQFASLQQNGNTLAYASSTNRDTIFGLSAGGASPMTNATVASNSIFGYLAGTNLTTGIKNTLFGEEALTAGTTTSDETAFGYNALWHTSTNDNTAFGYNAIGGSTGGGADNTAVGSLALQALTSAANNVGVGYNAGSHTTSGSQNVFVGSNAGNTLTTGQNDNGVGYNALGTVNASADNAFGYNAGLGLSSGGNNTLIGDQAGLTIGTGANNTALGAGSLRQAFSAAAGNTAIGSGSGFGITSGNQNIALGDSAASNVLYTGSYNTIIGDHIDLASPTLSNQLDIGNVLFGLNLYGAPTNTSSTPAINGAIGIGTTSPYAKFSIQSNIGDTLSTLFSISSTTSSLFTVDGSGNTKIAGALTLASLSGTNCLNEVGGVVGTTTCATGTVTGVTATYPILSSGGATPVISSAFGTTTANTFSSTQTFSVAPIFSTLTAGTANINSSGSLYATATSTATVGTGLSYTGTLGSFIAGTSGTLTNSGLLSLQQLGGGTAQTGAITLATSTSVTNGQTSGISITNIAGAFTFKPTLSGTLTLAGGGTGLATIGASSTVLQSNGTLAAWNTILFNEIGGLLNLATQVTGTLSIANGGTGLTTIGASSTVATSNGTSIVWQAITAATNFFTNSGATTTLNTGSVLAAGSFTSTSTATNVFGGFLSTEGWIVGTTTTVCLKPNACQFQANATSSDVAINAAEAFVAGNGGGKVNIQPGTYSINSPINITGSGVVLQGEGNNSTVLMATSSLNDYVIKVASTTLISRIEVRNLGINDNRTNQTAGGCIWAAATARATFDDDDIESCYGDGIKLSGTAASSFGYNNTISDNFINNTNIGIEAVTNDENQIYGNTINSFITYGIEDEQGLQNIHDNVFTGVVYNTGVGIYEYYTADTTIHHNTFDSVPNSAISILCNSTQGQMNVDDNFFHQTSFAGAGDPAIKVSGCTQNQFTNNYVNQTGKDPYAYQEVGTAPTATYFSNNTWYGTTTATSFIGTGNASSTSFFNNATSTPPAGMVWAQLDATGQLASNVPTGYGFYWAINGVKKLIVTAAGMVQIPALATPAGAFLAVDPSGNIIATTTPSGGGGGGTVTSVALSGGTTGLTVSGSPVTTSGTITVAGTLSTANGGSGLSNPGSLGTPALLEYYGSGGASPISVPSTGMVLNSNGSDFQFSKLTLSNTNTFTGVLPTTLGGTGWASIASGYITFGNGASSIATSTNLFWDNVNSRLGIGTTTPGSTFSIGSIANFASTLITYYTGLFVNGSLTSKEIVKTPSATPTFDWSATNQYEMTLTANVTSVTFSNLTAGQGIRLVLCQDGTGSRTVAWGTSNVLWTGGTVPTQTATANKCDIYPFTVTSATSTTKALGGAVQNY